MYAFIRKASNASRNRGLLNLRRRNCNRVLFTHGADESKTKHSKAKPKEQLAGEESGAMIQQSG
jgi:hypothetical protein